MLPQRLCLQSMFNLLINQFIILKLHKLIFFRFFSCQKKTLTRSNQILKIQRKSIFKASALWADAFYKLICPSVCLCVRLCVRLFTFEVPLKRLFAPTSWSQISKKKLEIRNPLGTGVERSGLRFEHFCSKMVKNRRSKK